MASIHGEAETSLAIVLNEKGLFLRIASVISVDYKGDLI